MRTAVALSIGLGLLVVVPLGLAVREQVRGHGPTSLRPDAGLAKHRPAPPPFLSDAQLLDQVLGPAPASAGPLFDGVTLGTSADNFLPDAARQRVQAFKAATGASVEFVFDATLDAIAVTATVSGTRSLDRALATLTQRWGPPTVDADGTLQWFDPALGTRVSISIGDDDAVAGADLDIEISGYFTAARFVAPANPARLGVEPIPLLGASLDQVRAAVGTGLERLGAEQYGWRALPLEGAGETVAIECMVRDARVVDVWIASYIAASPALLDAFTTKFGKPKRGKPDPTDPDAPDAADAIVLTWTRPDRVIALTTVPDAGFTLTLRPR